VTTESDLDTGVIWRSLGDFYDMFPESERSYWQTFWIAYADIVADLWGFTVQVDRSKSLYESDAVIERLHTAIRLGDLRRDRDYTFSLSRFYETSGTWLVKGVVPVGARDFKSNQLPKTGSLVIGVDALPYTSVNTESVAGGVYSGFVSEATFTLAGRPPRDYSDSIEVNDDFYFEPGRMTMRVDNVAGATFVDAFASGDLTVNDTGRLVLGVSGVNRQVVEYQSYVKLGDRYLFQLVAGQQLSSFHGQGEYLWVKAYDEDRWVQRLSGFGWLYADNAIYIQMPFSGNGSTSIRSLWELAPGVDFDVSVTMTLDSWPELSGADGIRRAAVQMTVADKSFVIGVESRRQSAVNTYGVIYGDLNSPTFSQRTINGPLELRFQRRGQVMSLSYRDGGPWLDLTSIQSPTMPAAMTMSLSRSGSNGDGLVSFSQVTRRDGVAVGSTRLESQFSARTRFPFSYQCDQRITSSPSLSDRPRPRSEQLVTGSPVDMGQTSVFAVPGPGFQAQGLPASGTLSIAGDRVVYDRASPLNGGYQFQLRRPLDPKVTPLAAGAPVVASTRVMSQNIDYQFDGSGRVSFADLPTRPVMWANSCLVDYKHVQETFGVLADVDSEISTEQYLRRVQGTWFALNTGPAVANVQTGLQLAVGLPVAQQEGTVRSISTFRDELGRMTSRSVVIASDDGSVFEYNLSKDQGLVDWTVAIGQRVARFQPLTTGVQVLDFQRDGLWHERFPGVSELERWNTFGVFIALEALSSASNVSEAIRFALRIKPAHTKLVIRFLLTTSGQETLNPQDDTLAAEVPRFCDELAFPRGEPPDDPEQILRLGEGHKLGQGKSLGGLGIWKFLGLGQEVLVADVPGDGSWSAGGQTFTTAGGYAFSASDIGHVIRLPLGAGEHKIMSVVSSSEVTVDRPFTASGSGGNWRLVDILSLSEGASLGLIRAYRCPQGPVNIASEYLDWQQVVTVFSEP